MKNEYTIYDDYVVMHIKRRNGTLLECYIDKEDYEKVSSFPFKWGSTWRPKIQNYYCVATIYLGMVDGKPKNDRIYSP
ncbi:hypothetical protein [Clostridium estertheticum]|uniref:hypothetical protein n=1 Tax=Clostridium estertheticum TaxID=238834 RepID=UPI001C0E771E|nr:hypothetical protein [Clostridium estertheticum]MBU3186525.1 hypothetical protein [Clostridium estertheticum]